jgi:glycine dehydrogenase
MLKSATLPLSELENAVEFRARHIGPWEGDEQHMLSVIGAASRRALIDAVVPRAIARAKPMHLPEPISEAQALKELKAIAAKNQVMKSFIGQGYHGTVTPGVVLRNILENPAWYTAYTPYQAEISQGRMEALINFQTMVCDLTAMPIANASMLDEATAAAEAMTLAKRSVKNKSSIFVVAGDCHPQTIEVIRTRAAPLGLTIKLAMSGDEWTQLLAGGDCFGALAQYPSTDGSIHDFRADAARLHAHGAAFIVAADLLALTLLVPPGEFGADIAIGNSQRFPGVQGRVQALDARPARRRQHRRAWRQGLPPRTANARAAHPPREGDEQHLHGAGAARRHCQHVRGLPRARGLEAHRAARGVVHRRAGARIA